MTKNISITSAFILVLSLAFTACKKDDDDDHTPVSATIVIEEPTLNDTVALGEELHMEGTITGTADLHGYVISAIKASNQAVLYTQSYDNHASSYNFHEHWVNDVTDTTIVTVRVDVTKDHDGNHEIKEVNVVCLPQ